MMTRLLRWICGLWIVTPRRQSKARWQVRFIPETSSERRIITATLISTGVDMEAEWVNVDAALASRFADEGMPVRLI